MSNPKCIVTDSDRRRLGSLLSTRANRAWGDGRSLAELDCVLDEATPVAQAFAPATLVTMNSTVELIDVQSGARRIVTLVYPQDVDLVDDGVSVFEPLGVALIGSQVGDVVHYRAADHRGKFRVVRLLYQPEGAGSWHL